MPEDQDTVRTTEEVDLTKHERYLKDQYGTTDPDKAAIKSLTRIMVALEAVADTLNLIYVKM